ELKASTRKLPSASYLSCWLETIAEAKRAKAHGLIRRNHSDYPAGRPCHWPAAQHVRGTDPRRVRQGRCLRHWRHHCRRHTHSRLAKRNDSQPVAVATGKSTRTAAF